ncbi:thiamine/thiamine pyrophosphate ABC transporter permease [Ciceribacter sp. L1K22]|uniref:thiamine/thiamine pyrophosphate ABC transporter permease n=1 Tax=Ciceribacter sp. L1K22 TaxID=2820275 RepID=UPI001ABE5610|nr:thiamine/thiamine pyrophosphate ABC transporter permease [Ciceribacter sp. L1K22]MBO3758185.1 thiamine/thiamine pyrophosphate ABC transporter permease [Ciceribacter sp. L1K22]
MTHVAGGAFGLVAILAFILAAVAALLTIGSGQGFASLVADPVILPALRFTLLQAGLSTLLSLLFGIPVALALARQRQFPGRIWLIRLMAVPMGLPVLIGALGLIGIWGRTGLVSTLLFGIGADEPLSIYGLSGILLAHVFFNMPLAARLLLAGLERVPAEYWMLSAELGMGRSATFRFVEWPVIARLLPGVAGLVFMLCATSFTLVLVLGGGPAATTLEVAIYQALRFDFDPARAVSLAVLQIGVTGALLAVISLLPAADEAIAGSERPVRRFDAGSGLVRLQDGLLILAAALFLGLPLMSILVSGLRADLFDLLIEPSFLSAAVTSLSIAGSAALLSTGLALLLVRAIIALRVRGSGLAFRLLSGSLSAAGSLVLLVPAIVLATGWFLILRPLGEISRFAPAIVIAINALMALPFVLRILTPAVEDHRRISGRLVASLGISGFVKLWRIDLPVLARPLAMAVSFAMALSLGDMGAVALFGAEDVTTLPWLIYSRLGSYRTNDADGLALILGVICLALTMLGTAGAKRSREAVAHV